MAKKSKAHGKTRVEKAEVALVRRGEEWLHHPVAKVLGAIGDIADEPPLLALSGATVALGLLRRDRRMARAGIRMLAAHAIAIAAKSYLKDNVDRSRPRKVLEDGSYKRKKGQSSDPGLRSFPSGHMAGAVAIARAAAREYPEHGLPFYAAAGIVGALQIPRKAHFPTDVLAGALVGAASEAASAALLQGGEKAIAAA